MQEYITVKTTKSVLKLIRLVSANTGEKQYEMLERLLKNELKKQKK